MWTRAELKNRGKTAFKSNFWKCVLVALIIALLSSDYTSNVSNRTESTSFSVGGSTFSVGFQLPAVFQGIDAVKGLFNVQEELYDFENMDITADTIDAYPAKSSSITVGPLVLSTTLGILAIVLFLVSVLLSVFVFSPLNVGGCRFFVNNLSRPAELDDLTFAFREGCFVNIGLAKLTTTIFTFLWTLLLIIPGIIKSYEYYLVPYLLADNPDWTGTDARAESKRLMDGNKWDTFVLDLSFIGWEILSAFTAGILSIFFVNPYMESTHAALYDRLVTDDAARHMQTEDGNANPYM